MQNGFEALKGKADSPRLLSIRKLSAGFGETAVLKSVSLSLGETGLLALVGPSGVGKSTLLRSLGRWNEQIPGFWTRGSVDLRGKDLLLALSREEALRRVALLAQKARLFTATVLDNAIDLARTEKQLSLPAKRELARTVLVPWALWDEFAPVLNQPVTSLSIARQRMLSMARLLSGGAETLLIDEPFRDIDPSEIPAMEDLVDRVREQVSIIMVTHNQQRARRLANYVCLLVDGCVVEFSSASLFFAGPQTSLGVRYLRDGNCWPVKPEDFKRAPDVDEAEVDDSEEPTVPAFGLPLAQSQARSGDGFARPGGFHWVIKGRLGGMQRPGLLRDEEEDLKALSSLGTQYLVSLTEEAFPPERLAQHGVVGIHFPIVDMGVPELDAAAQMVAAINRRIDAGMPTVLHCKAGLGRTGTLLACLLVYREFTAVGAINEVRCVNPRYIQSDVQLDFISRFADYVERNPQGPPVDRD